MPDRKQDVLDMLHELSELTILDEGDPQSFRVRAYENASHGVEAFTGELDALDVAGLQKIENVGKSTAEKIHELLQTGRVAKLEALRAKHPPGVVALLRLPGVGPKAVKRLRAELGVQSLDDLRAVLAAKQLRTLKGFSEKSEHKLAEALARLDAQGSATRTPISVALPLANRIVDRLREVPGVSFATFCGSLRRFSETCGDIDVVVAADAGSAAAVMDALVSMPLVDHVLGRGDTKTSVVTQRGLQIDVRVVAPEQLGAALLYFTGSKAHNVKLRQRALARGLTLNEYALSKLVEPGEAAEAAETAEATETAVAAVAGEIVARETEEQIYAALGLPFIPPTLREDAGEVEAAEAGTLPRPLGAVVGDFHVHTTVSGDGRSPIEDVIAMAKARGLRVLALTDHAEGTVAGVSRDKLLAQRAQIRGLQAQLGTSLILLHGVELNIGPNGELDYDLEFRRGFDWCVASVHDHFDLDRAAQTKRVVTAMQDPTVRMIGHLTARMIGARPGIELDADAIFAAATATGTALEINGALPRLDLSVDWLRRARGRDVTFLLSSDAHRAEELARTDHAKLNAERAGLDPARVLNAGPPDRLIDWLREKRPA